MKITWFVLIILLIPIVSAQEIKIENKTIEITSLINESVCNGTTNVFKITNLNYSSGDNTTTISYVQGWNNQKVNITKEIKKYSQTNTGEIKEIENKENTLSFILNNQTIEWKINSSCLETNKTKINNTVELVETNKSTNQTANNTIQEKNTKEKLVVKINKNIFAEGEKILFNFVNNTRPVSYWIEDSKGNIVKDKYTTSNDNQKSYTFKEQEENEKIYVLVSKTIDEEKRILLGVTKTVEENQESEISINKAEYEDDKISIEVEINRGSTKKTTIYCYTKTDEKRSSEETKVKINSQNNKITISTVMLPKNKWKNETSVICEGLDTQDGVKVKTPQRKEINEENTNDKKEEKVETKIEEKITKKTVNSTAIIEKKENIITGKTSAYNKSSKKEKTSTTIILTALISMFLGGFMSYGPKKVIDKFIKK